jgi:hypothetical protein
VGGQQAAGVAEQLRLDDRHRRCTTPRHRHRAQAARRTSRGSGSCPPGGSPRAPLSGVGVPFLHSPTYQRESMGCPLRAESWAPGRGKRAKVRAEVVDVPGGRPAHVRCPPVHKQPGMLAGAGKRRLGHHELAAALRAAPQSPGFRVARGHGLGAPRACRLQTRTQCWAQGVGVYTATRPGLCRASGSR